MALFPSQQWCDQWQNAMNNDPAVAETGKNWGVNFNGNWVFELQPGSGLDKTVYVYLETECGKCNDARIIDNPSDFDTGFFAIGSYHDYKSVVKGEMDFIEGVLKGIFKLNGDMSKIMQNAKFIRAVANSISSFESEYFGD